MLYIQIRDQSLEKLKKLIRKYDDRAFIVVNETKYVENGYVKYAFSHFYSYDIQK